VVPVIVRAHEVDKVVPGGSDVGGQVLTHSDDPFANRHRRKSLSASRTGI
jgi:hypothetical protein